MEEDDTGRIPMKQRDFSSWSQPGHSRPRLLIEDPDPALRLADFSLFTESGLDVALCSGPSAEEPCPLVGAGECRLADAADVVLMGLGMAGHRHEVAAALHRRRPALPVLVEVRRHGKETAPEGCAPLRVPVSVDGQIRAVWRALDRPARPAPFPSASPWPRDPEAQPRESSHRAPAAPWPRDPSAPAPSTAESSLEARLADLLGW
jgi:hypothetical protein